MTAACPAVTVEASAPYQYNFWTEFDITFWQTLPFATLWTAVLERNVYNIFVPAATTRWELVLPVAVALSVGNAYFHSKAVMENAAR